MKHAINYILAILSGNSTDFCSSSNVKQFFRNLFCKADFANWHRELALVPVTGPALLCFIKAELNNDNCRTGHILMFKVVFHVKMIVEKIARIINQQIFFKKCCAKILN